MIHLIDTISSGATLLLCFIVGINHAQVNKQANKWFSVFMAMLFLVQIQNIVVASKIAREDDLWFQLISLSTFLVAPIFYITVSYYIDPFKKWKWRDLKHLLFAFFILILIVASLFVEDPNKEEINNPEIVSRVDFLFKTIFGLQVATYCILSLRKINKHKRAIEHLYSSVYGINLNWLRNISLITLTIAFLWIADILFELSEQTQTYDFLSSIIYISGVFYIGYNWLIQGETYPKLEMANNPIDSSILNITEPAEIKKKLLTAEQLQDYKKKLTELMMESEPFMDTELNLLKLSAQLNVTPHTLSYIINEGFGDNFFQFINHYRIEKAKKLILDPGMNHLKLLGIGYEVGFNSKTAFNTTFKRLTGLTPSTYKKNHLKSSSNL